MGDGKRGTCFLKHTFQHFSAATKEFPCLMAMLPRRRHEASAADLGHRVQFGFRGLEVYRTQKLHVEMTRSLLCEPERISPLAKLGLACVVKAQKTKDLAMPS